MVNANTSSQQVSEYLVLFTVAREIHVLLFFYPSDHEGRYLSDQELL